MNPVLDLLRSNHIPLSAAWLPHKSQMYDGPTLGSLASPTIPGSPNYLPPLKPAHIPMDDWLPRISELMNESAYGFIAEVWTAILSRRDPAITPSIHLLWNDQIPKPSRLSALFWLFVCEVWPMVQSHERLRLALKYRTGDEFPVGVAHPPQPFMIPMSQHLNIAGSLPTPPARSSYRTPNHQQLSTLLAQSMTRRDRELMSQMSIDHVPIYMPHKENRVTLADHIVGGYDYVSESGFLANRDMYEVGGHAHEPLAESYHHVAAIVKLREYIMAGLSVQPGLSTTISNVYGVPGGWIRCLSEDNLYINTSRMPLQTWGMNQESILINGKRSGPSLPAMMPRVWFGWTGTQRWLPQMEEFAAHFEWVKTYLEVRPFAIRLLFEPDVMNLDTAKYEALSKRHDVLTRVKRFAAPSKTDDNITNAFKSLGASFKQT